MSLISTLARRMFFPTLQFALLVLLLLAHPAVDARTSYPSLTYATGPTCYPSGLQCDGPGVVSAPCCDLTKNVCASVPGKDHKYCVFRNTNCLETTSDCQNASKPCCDPAAVCMDDWDAQGLNVVGKSCQKTCYDDNVRCEGAPGMPYVFAKPCCSANYECVEIGDGLWGKFCTPKASP